VGLLGIQADNTVLEDLAASEEEIGAHILTRFLELALRRLQRANPGWAELTWSQFHDFAFGYTMEGFADRQPTTTRAKRHRTAWIKRQLERYEGTRLGPGEFKHSERRPEFLLSRYEDLVDRYRQAGSKRPSQEAAERLSAELMITVRHLQQNLLVEWRRRRRNGLDDPAHRWRKGGRRHRPDVC